MRVRNKTKGKQFKTKVWMPTAATGKEAVDIEYIIGFILGAAGTVALFVALALILGDLN